MRSNHQATAKKKQYMLFHSDFEKNGSETVVFVKHHSNRVTEITLAPLEMNVIEIPLS